MTRSWVCPKLWVALFKWSPGILQNFFALTLFFINQSIEIAQYKVSCHYTSVTLLLFSQNNKNLFIINPAGWYTEYTTISSFEQLNYNSIHSKLLNFLHENLATDIYRPTIAPTTPPGSLRLIPGRLTRWNLWVSGVCRCFNPSS